MHGGRKAAIIGGAFAAVLGGGYGAYAFLDGGSPDDGGGSGAGRPSTAQAAATARDFLSSWQDGSVARAAALTDDVGAARTSLTGFHEDAHVASVRLRRGSVHGQTVPFTVRADVSYRGRHVKWTYDSTLSVVRDGATGRARVDWRPSVLHPELDRGEKLVVTASENPPITALDRDGAPLRPEKHPGLRDVLAGLRDRYGDLAGGRAGLVARVANVDDETPAAGRSDRQDGSSPQRGRVLLELSKGEPGTLRTTLDSDVQSAAERAVRGRSRAATVALQPSTGDVLAVAGSSADDSETALRGSLAPGSTMKVITAAMLLDKGLTGPDAPHPCPRYASYGGWRFQNLDKFRIEGGTFADSFSRSCNTAFITQAEKLEDDSLADEAREVFGIGLDWHTGVTTFDGRVPVASGAPMAAGLIGQGGVRMNPLTMASIAATARTGAFHQPVLVSPSLDGRRIAAAPRSMAPSTAEQLRSLMRTTAIRGTAAQAMAGIGGDVGAKTGSAEVDGQKQTDGWFTAYRDDVAAAAVVPEGGHGGDSAGPVVASILRAG